MRRKAMLLSLLMALGLGSGCTYMKDRAFDFVDMFGIKFLFGGGMRVGVGIGALKNGGYLGVGFWPINPSGPAPVAGYLVDWSWYNMEKFGFQGRAAGWWHEKGMDFAMPIDHELTAIWGNSFLDESVAEFNEIEHVDENLSGHHRDHHPSLDPLTRPIHRYHNISDLQVTAFVFLGAEANTSLIQVVDFITGWFLVDITRDDERNRVEERDSRQEAQEIEGK